jgi:hypothetical protein
VLLSEQVTKRAATLAELLDRELKFRRSMVRPSAAVRERVPA